MQYITSVYEYAFAAVAGTYEDEEKSNYESESSEAGSEAMRGRDHSGSDTLARPLISLDEEEYADDDLNCGCNCFMFINFCIPAYSKCLCVYNVLRSIPFSSLVCFSLVLSGWCISADRLETLNKVIKHSNLEIVDEVGTFVRNLGWLTFVGVFFVIVTSVLLTGWTKTALFKALETGIVRYEEDSDASCKCNRFLVKYFSYGYLFLVTLLAQVLWLSALVGALGSFEYFFFVRLTTEECKKKESDQLQGFFNVATDYCKLRLIRRIPHEEIDVRVYCKHEEKIFNDTIFIFVGFIIMVAGQVFLSNIMMKNVMVARREFRDIDDKKNDDVLLEASLALDSV